jgi:Tol biopolymer transport system component
MRLTVAVAIGLLTLAAPSVVGAAYPGDNGRIAITSDWGCDGSYIQTLRPNGSGLRPLNERPCEREVEPDRFGSWTADGRTLVFNARRGPGGPDDVQSVMAARADGSDMRPLPVPYGEKPHTSPSGQQLVYERLSEAGVVEIWIVNIDGSGLTRLGTGRDPRFSPTGRTIAFVSRGLRLMSTDGTFIRRITRANVSQYDWSPNGRRLAYTTFGRNGKAGDLFTTGVRGQDRRRFTSSTRKEEASPAWSPDGRWIAFVRRVPGKGESGGPLRTVRRDRSTGRSRSRLVTKLPPPFESFVLHPTTLSWQARP